MNSATGSHYRNASMKKNTSQKVTADYFLNLSIKNERKILKAFILSQLYQLFYELFQNKLKCNNNIFLMEYYTMDSKIIQVLINSIVETEEYTLEGIAHYTHIPFDVIFDAACGISNQFSITPWARIVDLYLQLKPDVAQVLINKLLEVKEKNHAALSMLLNEP